MNRFIEQRDVLDPLCPRSEKERDGSVLGPAKRSSRLDARARGEYLEVDSGWNDDGAVAADARCERRAYEDGCADARDGPGDGPLPLNLSAAVASVERRDHRHSTLSHCYCASQPVVGMNKVDRLRCEHSAQLRHSPGVVPRLV